MLPREGEMLGYEFDSRLGLYCGGGSCMNGGSGEHEDARDRGLLSRDAFDKEGVGGPLSDGVGDGDLEREP